ncbi:MAG TPA: hypothetical protein VLL48_10660, partial [Longimicrobiales bacterium]|nr:hypothetical protein [Longimicrobiales bacterium]
MEPESRTNTRPELASGFFKGHGLGNDYLVFEGGDAWRASPAAVAAVCHRTRGVGADGIVSVSDRGDEGWTLRMFNPDGGEFERSGNGLRIFGAHLARRGELAEGETIAVRTGGDTVRLTLEGRGDDGTCRVAVEMGRAAVGPE